ncbi:hypothetical protein Tco_1546071 [Tanacetum coccineum]
MSLSLAKNVIVAGADNHPFMLDKTQYSSWASLTEPRTVTTPATVRDKRYDELTDAEKLHEACDIKATKIVLQGLPQDIYNLVNHHEEAKHIWDKVMLLIKVSIRQWLSLAPHLLLNTLQPTTSSEPRLTQRIRQLSKMEELPCRQFREDKIREEGHMARQCTKPKRPRNSAWFKDKEMLAEALESGVVLDEEQMAFLADNGDIVC